MDRFEAMRAFVCVVDTGSFTRAAAHLGLSRASVSALVQQLETHLRVRLLHRTTRRLQLTSEGQAYCPRARELLQALDEVEAGLAGSRQLPCGRLRIDVPTPFAQWLLLPALAGFHARYPDIEIDLGASDRAVDLAGEQVDCVIRSGGLLAPDLVARPLAILPVGLFAAPAYLAAHGSPGDPQALAEAPHWQVRFRWGRQARALPWQLQRDGQVVSVAPRSRLAVDDGTACLAAACAGLGVVLMPRYMAAQALERGQLLPVLEDWQAEPLPLHLAWPGQRPVSARLRVFIDWLLQHPDITAAGVAPAL